VTKTEPAIGHAKIAFRFGLPFDSSLWMLRFVPQINHASSTSAEGRGRK